MAIEFLCPACNGTLSMADDAAGKLVRCGNCLATLRVPEAAPVESARPAYEPAPTRKPEPEDRGDRDEHGEPRPRRANKKKKAGRGPLFWIVIILFALGLFTCVACGGVMALLAKARWHTHDSPDGGYTVEFPAQLHPNIAQDAKLELEKNARVEGAVLVGRLEFYWVWYAPFKKGMGPGINDKFIIDEAVKNMIQDGKGTVIRETPMMRDGCTAREVVIAVEDGDQTHHCLVVVGRTKLYVVAAGGPFVSQEGNSRIRRYLDSFHLKP